MGQNLTIQGLSTTFVKFYIWWENYHQLHAYCHKQINQHMHNSIDMSDPLETLKTSSLLKGTLLHYWQERKISSAIMEKRMEAPKKPNTELP